MVRHGRARCGKAGEARPGKEGLGRRDKVRRDKERRVPSGLGQAVKGVGIVLLPNIQPVERITTHGYGNKGKNRDSDGRYFTA